MAGRAAAAGRGEPGQWVMLVYRLPREPSTPRIAVWRKLKRLGVAQLADGLVALPADARTREQLEWIADEIVEAGGAAGVWIARPAAASQERERAGAMVAARAAEYQAVITEAVAGDVVNEAGRASLARRLRAELRRIARRDYFPPPERELARAAVEALVTPHPRGSAKSDDLE
ncbi:Chromate resistance protein ChrB [Pseudonocardia nigra]|uniref:Chromate resistance protein ChrB n=1 Tax=Pseudonocardia nigra TaxID=1921578 RepID=UPI001FE79351|nr:Chromate resistance protein ChrB [Pseudonocardia nigra]